MRLRTFIPFVLLIGVLLVAACAPVTPVIPQTGPDTQGTVMPGDSGQGGTGGTTGGQEGSGTNQGGTGTGQGGTGTNQGGTGTNQGGTTGGNQNGTGTGGTGTGGTGTGGTGTGNNQGGIVGGQGGLGNGNTAPSPSGSQNNLNQNLQDAISGFVAQQSGGASGDVEILFAQQIDFQNGCLGLTNQGETCSQAVTPGWQVVARSNGNLYVIHTDSNGNNVRWNENADANAIMGSGTGTGTGNNQSGTGGTGNNQGGQSGGTGTGTGNNQGGTGTGNNQGGTGGTGGTGGNTGGTGSNGGTNQGGGADGGGLRVGLDQVINLASQFLGQTLNVPVNQVSFSGVTVETWSDSCLGVGQANESCAQVTTPGYRISFTVGGQNYELRTDSTGSNMRLVQGGQQ